MAQSFAHGCADLRIVGRSPQRIHGIQAHAVIKLAAVSDNVREHATNFGVIRCSFDDARTRRADMQFHFGSRRIALRLQTNSVATDSLELLLSYGCRSGDSDRRFAWKGRGNLAIPFASRCAGKGANEQEGGCAPTRMKRKRLPKRHPSPGRQERAPEALRLRSGIIQPFKK